MADSAPTILAHIGHVQELLDQIATDLLKRGVLHDASKFDPIEKGPLDEMQRLLEQEGPAPYGTEAYGRRTALLAPMLAHHYANNDHHPEHFPAGVAGMDLMMVIEMLCDWRAANLDRDAGAPMNLSFSIEKFKIEPMLASILWNTVRNLGWDAK